MTAPQHQGGVALLVALMVLAAATAIAVGLAQQAGISLNRTQHMLTANRAWNYASGMEAWARQVLQEDFNRQGLLDTPRDIWNQSPPPLPVPGGQVSGSLQELSGRLNVNDLVTEEGQADPLAVARMARLLASLQLERRLADSLVDYLDADSVPRGGGAEDPHYSAQKLPTLAANQRLADLSELRGVAGFDGETVEALRPFLRAAPAGHPVNVNTAPPEVLAALAENMTVTQAQGIAGKREFGNISEFIQYVDEIGVVVDPTGLGVTSHHFLASTLVALDARSFEFTALIQRDAGLRTLWRRRGGG